MTYLNSMKQATLMDLFKRWPGARKGLHDFLQPVMRGESELSEAERELIAAYVSGLNKCAFCEQAHRQAAIELGIEQDVLQRLYESIESSPVDDRLKPLLHYVRKLTLEQEAVGQADVDSVYAAGWGELTLTQVVFICGYFNLMPRVVTGLGLSSSPEAVSAAARHLVDHGYR